MKTKLIVFAAVCVAAIVLFSAFHAEREFQTFANRGDAELKMSLASNASVKVGDWPHRTKTAGVYEMRRSRQMPYLSAGTYTRATKDGSDVYVFKPDSGDSWAAKVETDGSLTDQRGTWNLEKTANGVSTASTDIVKAFLNK